MKVELYINEELRDSVDIMTRSQYQQGCSTIEERAHAAIYRQRRYAERQSQPWYIVIVGIKSKGNNIQNIED